MYLPAEFANPVFVFVIQSSFWKVLFSFLVHIDFNVLYPFCNPLCLSIHAFELVSEADSEQIGKKLGRFCEHQSYGAWAYSSHFILFYFFQKSIWPIDTKKRGRETSQPLLPTPSLIILLPFLSRATLVHLEREDKSLDLVEIWLHF